jgi:CelD/BcsL family acetyltransferase involved in cellulose biosynthesis
MTVHITQESFEALAPAWTQLLPACDANTLFLTPLWQKTWWETLGQAAANGAPAQLMLLKVRGESGPIGVAPLQRAGDTIAFLGDTDVFDYHDFVVQRGCEHEFYAALCDHLTGIPGWTRLYLPSVPEGSPTLEHLPQEAQRLGWECSTEKEDVAPGLPLPKSWDDYLANALSKKDRHELRRKMRRLFSAAQPTYRTYVDSDSDALADRFLVLMRDGNADKQTFLTPAREQFFRAMCRATSGAGVLRLHFLEMDGKAVAGALSFDYAGRRLLYNSGFSPDYYQLAVGLLLKAMTVQEAIEQGMEYYDFLRGNEPYKYDLGAQDHAVYRMEIRR